MATLKEKAEKTKKAITAAEIETKKTVRSKARAAKETLSGKTKAASAKAAKTAEDVKDTAAGAAILADDRAVANKIEAKKKTRAAGRKTKEAVEKATLPAAEKIDEIKLGQEMGAGRTRAKVTRKKAETEQKVKAAVKKPARKKIPSKMNIIIQSPLGGVITPEQVAAKVPKDAVDVYIRVDENRIYWVGEEGVGSVEIWE